MSDIKSRLRRIELDQANRPEPISTMPAPVAAAMLRAAVEAHDAGLPLKEVHRAMERAGRRQSAEEGVRP